MNKKMWKNFFIFLGVSLLSTSCGLLNSVNISMRHSVPTENIQGRDYDTEKLSERFPEIIGISAKNVSHPSFYKPFDATIKLKPSIHLERLYMKTKDKRINPNNGAYEEYPPIKMTRFSALINLNFIGHTPIGAFYFIVGYGQTVYKADDGETIDVTQSTDIMKYELSHVAFFSKRFYLNLSVRLLDSKIPTASAALKIGYYFSDVRN